MPSTALRRVLLAIACLTGAGLACVTAEVPILPAGQQISTPLPQVASATAPVVVVPTNTAAPGATSTPGSTPTPLVSPTATRDFDLIPITNGSFDADLNGWQFTPDWVMWQDGYARANASDIIGGASLVQTVGVPGAPSVVLHFRARSEDIGTGECWVESKFRSVHVFPEDSEWREFKVDFTAEAGTDAPVSLTAKNNGHCHWVHLDDVYWMVTLGYAAGLPSATASPILPTTTATSPATSTPDVIATLPAIPSGAVFTQDFTVSAEGGNPIGSPRDLRDKQTITWASLRNGQGSWVLDLGGDRSVAGVRLFAHRDGDQDTTLLGIEVSRDGNDWTEVVRGSGVCGDTPNCDVIAQEQYVDFAFGPITARYVRLVGGPTRFAIAEVLLAVMP